MIGIAFAPWFADHDDFVGAITGVLWCQVMTIRVFFSLSWRCCVLKLGQLGRKRGFDELRIRG